MVFPVFSGSPLNENADSLLARLILKTIGKSDLLIMSISLELIEGNYDP